MFHLNLSILFFLLAVSSFNSYADEGFDVNRLKNEPITPIPDVVGLDSNKVALGKRLFHDVNLSGNGTVSCATCHHLSNAGMDSLPHSIGINGKAGKINAPTILNSSLSFRQFWDGRAATLEEQVLGPLTDPVEMGSNWNHIYKYINSTSFYKQAFRKNYPNIELKKAIPNAIAEFERSLLTPNGAFDLYLKGNDQAISAQAKRGYKLFKSYGCISCHQGVAVGGNFYEKLGVIFPYFDKKTAKKSDFGRFLITKEIKDKFEFKVPGLRNVAKTAPYLHNGEIKTLETVVQIMAKNQLGRYISSPEISDIVSFLETLNGELNVE